MAWIFWLLAIAMLVYEFIALSRGRHETVSEIVWALARRPLVPFAMGMLMGHFFWQAC